MNLMTVDGYSAKIEYDAETDLFRGEILGLSGGADFYGANPDELRTEFKKSLDVFLEVCREKGIEPRKQFSGKFNLQIPPDLHEKLAMTAQAQGKSLNSLAQEALEKSVLAQATEAPQPKGSRAQMFLLGRS
jgi:predicted HicB family RNase H-like nuclease